MELPKIFSFVPTGFPLSWVWQVHQLFSSVDVIETAGLLVELVVGRAAPLQLCVLDLEPALVFAFHAHTEIFLHANFK